MVFRGSVVTEAIVYREATQGNSEPDGTLLYTYEVWIHASVHSPKSIQLFTKKNDFYCVICVLFCWPPCSTWSSQARDQIEATVVTWGNTGSSNPLCQAGIQPASWCCKELPILLHHHGNSLILLFICQAVGMEREEGLLVMTGGEMNLNHFIQIT